MSLNAVIEQKYIPEVEALAALLNEFIAQWKAAPSIQQRMLIESEAISTFQRILDLSLEIEEVMPGEHPDVGEINATYGQYVYMLRANISRLTRIAELYLSHFNSQQIALMEVIGKMREVKQKYATYSLWQGEDAKYVAANHFYNWNSLNAELTSLALCDVDTAQGVVTLPVRSSNLIPVVTARVGSQSNGNPGNSNLDVTTNNTNPSFVVNGEVDNWFEYERLHTGPCDLTLVLELEKEEIVNSISIQPVNLGTSLVYDVEDIIFARSNNEGTSIKDLVSGDFDREFFTVKSVSSDNAWNVTFLPTSAKTVSIKLRATQGYQINISSTDERIVKARRYAIALKDVSIFRKEFEAEGGINSGEMTLPGGLYAAIPFIDVWPSNPVLFDATLETSFDSGETWRSSTEIDDGVGSTILMQGDETSLIWRLSLSRNDETFSSLESFIPNETLTPDVSTSLHTVSRLISPATFSLSEKPLDNEVIAIQPKIARRGGKFKGILIGEGTGTELTLDLPFYRVKTKVLDAISIYVNGRIYARSDDNSNVVAGQWAFSDDYRQVELPDSVPVGARIVLVLAEEPMFFTERSDGFYHQMEFLFDPDIENINVKYLPRGGKAQNYVLPRDSKAIKLPHSYVQEGSLRLESRNSVTYTEVTTALDLAATFDSYLVDYQNGVVRLNSEFGSDTVTAQYIHYTPSVIPREKYASVFVEGRPWGVKVDKDVFVAQSASETIGDSLLDVMDVNTGVYGPRTDTMAGSDKARVLSYDCIVNGTVKVSSNLLSTSTPPEEVTFIDGHTEFRGLTPMLRESTVTIEAGAEEYVTFTLSAGALWHRPLGVTFGNTAVFSSKVASASAARTGSAGDYFTSNNGTVTVNVGVGGTLTTGIPYTYWYKDPDFDASNKFSVDYENGYLYSETDLNDVATIDYKTACYEVAYDMAAEIDSVTYNQNINTVSVRTEGLDPVNSLVKLIWTEAPEVSELDELKDFFSPIISVLAFRFS